MGSETLIERRRSRVSMGSKTLIERNVSVT
jgi:hypothetical protein